MGAFMSRVPFLVVSTGVIMLTVCGVYQKMWLFRSFDHGKIIQGKPKGTPPLSYLLKTQLYNFLGNMGYMSVKD